MEAIINAVSECNRYGDSRCDGLREKLARNTERLRTGP